MTGEKTPFVIPHEQPLDGAPFYRLFPRSVNDHYRIVSIMRTLKVYLEKGNEIFFEFTDGARKGTIGRLKVNASEVESLYINENRKHIGCQKTTWELVFDDRKNVVKLEPGWDQKLPGVLRFNCEATVWSYTSKARDKEDDAELYDHFGVLLAVGQLVMFPEGRKGAVHTRFGYIKNITAKGTIKVESVKTRPGHRKVEDNLSPTIYPSDLVVLDNNDIKDKVTMAKLMNG